MSDDVRITPAEMRIIIQEASGGFVHILAVAPMVPELVRLLDEGSEDS